MHPEARLLTTNVRTGQPLLRSESIDTTCRRQVRRTTRCGMIESKEFSGIIVDESIETSCPYCGAAVELQIDAGGGERQQYVEDCPVCCQPWNVEVLQAAEGEWTASIRTADE